MRKEKTIFFGISNLKKKWKNQNIKKKRKNLHDLPGARFARKKVNARHF
jgi:hypothetical protein